MTDMAQTATAGEGDGFDIIGDVHGCLAPLETLLSALGYQELDGVHRHPIRQAVFVGDLIDRGPDQVGVIRLVRAMVEAGSAQIVMGNHEFNAIAYATPDPLRPGQYLRPHDAKNTKQHAEFLAQIGEGSDDHHDAIDWFRTMPLWLDLGGVRVVHACWDPDAIAGLRSPFLTDEVLVAASTPGTPEFGWIEHLCKGPEIELPAECPSSTRTTTFATTPASAGGTHLCRPTPTRARCRRRLGTPPRRTGPPADAGRPVRRRDPRGVRPLLAKVGATRSHRQLPASTTPVSRAAHSSPTNGAERLCSNSIISSLLGGTDGALTPTWYDPSVKAVTCTSCQPVE